MEDRVPTLRGRIKKTADPNDTTGKFFYIQRADQPTVTGTPLCSATLFTSENSDRYCCNIPSQAFYLLGKTWKCSVVLGNWSEDSVNGYYVNEIPFAAMKEAYSPIFTFAPTNAELEDDEKYAFNLIGKIEATDGKLIAYAKVKPEINFNMWVKGV